MDKRCIVELNNINMVYHTLEEETLALKDVNLEIYDGELIGIVGPSGCGKSTLLSIIAGLIKPTSGSIRVKGNLVEKPLKNIGYMFQKDQLFDWRNIISNVVLGLEIQGRLNNETLEEAKELLENYGLGDFLYSYPYQLSGGMRQRVALARTMILKPDILLLDEPFSALDYQTRLAISDEVGIILRENKKTAILVTHDIAEAISLCDRIVIMSKRPGTIKDIIDINLTCEGESTPIKLREAPEFRHYFNKIWKELDIHVQ
jgi:NitT/TauT family transport system ATP-binding protein